MIETRKANISLYDSKKASARAFDMCLKGLQLVYYSFLIILLKLF